MLADATVVQTLNFAYCDGIGNTDFAGFCQFLAIGLKKWKFPEFFDVADKVRKNPDIKKLSRCGRLWMSKHYIIYLKLLATAVLWGGTFVAGRVLSREVEPFSAAFLRFSLASVCLLYFMKIQHARAHKHQSGAVSPAASGAQGGPDTDGSRPVRPLQSAHPRFLSLKDWLACVSLGLSGVFIYNVFFFMGLKTVEAGRAAIFIACNPICIAVLAALFMGETMRPLRFAGILISLFGALLAITRGNPAEIFGEHLAVGDLYILGCVVSWLFYVLMGKVVTRRLSSLAAVAYACSIGALLLLPFALYEGLLRNIFNFSLTAWACIIYFSLLATALGFTWFYEGVKELGASRAGVFINFVPLVAIFGGHFLLGESLSFSLLVGVLLVCGGTLLVNRT